MAALFQRQVVLQIGTANDAGREYTGLRCRFRVEMSRTSNPNTAVIELYNPNKGSVALAQAEGVIVRLLVGYDVPLQIFRGNPVAGGVSLSRQGPDRVLRIEAQDGGRELAAGRVSVSVSTSTSAQQVFDELSDALGLALGSVRVEGGLTLTQGAVLQGKASDVLDDLVRSMGLEWYVRDGALYVGTEGESTGETAVVFSSATKNLIGTPTRKDGAVEATALISPSMRPGKPFRVESLDITGDFVAEDVVFEGDSGYENPFYVKVTGRPV